MKDNIDNALDFLFNLLGRLLPFAMLMIAIAIISTFLISIFNQDFAFKVFHINMFIGIIPLVIAFLLITILALIRLTIYGED